jgi:hypothetical protein
MQRRIALSVVEAETPWRSRTAIEIVVTEIAKETEVRDLTAMLAVMLGHLVVRSQMHMKPIDAKPLRIARRTTEKLFLLKDCWNLVVVQMTETAIAISTDLATVVAMMTEIEETEERMSGRDCIGEEEIQEEASMSYLMVMKSPIVADEELTVRLKAWVAGETRRYVYFLYCGIFG